MKESAANRIAGLPGTIWALGFVSLFMDIASEMVHSLLPVFLVSTLGASATAIGWIEGVGEGTASITKLFSGWLSDRWRQRKSLTLLGYGLGALSKPLFAIAPSVGWVLFARFSDRIGKGVRGAPRDALVADLTPANLRGAAYGLRQSLDTVGAFAGPLVAMGLMYVSGDDFRTVFALAILPGAAAVLLLAFGVREPEVVATGVARPLPLHWNDLGRLPARLWLVIGITAVLTLGRFSEAFLILRARDAGLPMAAAPLVLIAMNLVFSLSAYPVGILSDRVSRGWLLASGYIVLIVADLVLATAASLGGVMGGILLWGLHLGMNQGLLAALVADHAPADLRGSAFGLFHLFGGAALLVASVLAGFLWEQAGPRATFLMGAGWTAVGVAIASALGWREERSRRGTGL